MNRPFKTIPCLLLLCFLTGCSLFAPPPMPAPPENYTPLPVPSQTEQTISVCSTEEIETVLAKYLDVSAYTTERVTEDERIFVSQQGSTGSYPLDYVVSFAGGGSISLPTTYDALSADGWDAEVAASDRQLSSGASMEATWRSETGKKISVRAGNAGKDIQPYRNCTLFRISVTLRDVEDFFATPLSTAPDFQLLNGAITRSCSLPQAISVLGEPNKIIYSIGSANRYSLLRLFFANDETARLELTFTGDGQNLVSFLYGTNPEFQTG